MEPWSRPARGQTALTFGREGVRRIRAYPAYPVAATARLAPKGKAG